MGRRELPGPAAMLNMLPSRNGKHSPRPDETSSAKHRGDELAFVRQQVAEEARGLAQGFLVDGHLRGRAVIGDGGGNGIGHGGTVEKEPGKAKRPARIARRAGFFPLDKTRVRRKLPFSLPMTIPPRLLLLLGVATLTGQTALADVRLPVFFSDHMVLQRDRPLPVWGWADKGENVTVRLGGQSKTATADDKGEWTVRLDPLPATAATAAALTLEVEGHNRVAIQDVLVGEVWLCSGQSNMEFRVERALDAAKEIAAADNPRIRQFHAPYAGAPEPQDATFFKTGRWEEATPKTVGTFTAAGILLCPRHQPRARRDAGRPAPQFMGRHADPGVDADGVHRGPAGPPRGAAEKTRKGNRRLARASGKDRGCHGRMAKESRRGQGRRSTHAGGQAVEPRFARSAAMDGREPLQRHDPSAAAVRDPGGRCGIRARPTPGPTRKARWNTPPCKPT